MFAIRCLVPTFRDFPGQTETARDFVEGTYNSLQAAELALMETATRMMRQYNAQGDWVSYDQERGEVVLFSDLSDGPVTYYIAQAVEPTARMLQA